MSFGFQQLGQTLVGTNDHDNLVVQLKPGYDRTGGDRIFGLDGNDIIGGGHGNDDLEGGSGNDRIFGHQDNDKLFGQAGNDYLNGGTGYDILDGGTGSNFMYGGADNDIFFVDGRGAHFPGSTPTWSTIADWGRGNNKLDIWGWEPNKSTLIFEFESSGAANFQGATLHYDLDGNGLIDTSITFTGQSLSDLPDPTIGNIEGNWYVEFA